MSTRLLLDKVDQVVFTQRVWTHPAGTRRVYADPERTRAYQAQYQPARIRRLRTEWIDENGPCVECGSSIRLEVDHVDPATKDHALSKPLWSHAPVVREHELAKCQVLCHECHRAKTSAEARCRRRNVVHSPDESPETATMSLTDAAKILGIHRTTAYDLARAGTFPVPVFRVGSLIKVNKAQLESYVQGGRAPSNPAA